MNAVKPVRIANIILLSLGLLLVTNVQAARLQNPYVVDVPVATQSAEDRKTATAIGLQQLLARLSGQAVSDTLTKELAAAGKLESYLLQYGYVKNVPAPAFNALPVDAPQAMTPQSPASTQPLSVSPLSTPQQSVSAAVALAPVTMPWRLHLEFSPTVLNALMQEKGLTLWPLDRPQVQLWMTDDSGALSAASNRPEVTRVIVDIANARGVPLSVADSLLAAGTSNLPASALQNQDIAQLLPLLPVQTADAFLFARIGGDDVQGWDLHWLLHFRDQDYRFEEKNKDIYIALDKSLQQVAGYLSGNYRSSVTADTGSVQLRLRVEGVQSFESYSRLRDYVEKLDVVQRAAIIQVNGGVVIIDIDAKGRESLRSLLALFKSLQWQEEILPPAGSDTTVRTVWRYNFQN
jgi:hypothetical protein